MRNTAKQRQTMKDIFAAQPLFLCVWAGQRNPPDRIRRTGRLATSRPRAPGAGLEILRLTWGNECSQSLAAARWFSPFEGLSRDSEGLRGTPRDSGGTGRASRDSRLANHRSHGAPLGGLFGWSRASGPTLVGLAGWVQAGGTRGTRLR